jgi:hypothetical protein
MARGRKQEQTVQDTPLVELNQQALATANQALTTMSVQAIAIQQQFGLESIDPATLEAEIAIWAEHANRSLHMVGARLLALRTVSVQGEWLERLNRLSIGERLARRLMAATLKCVAADGKPREKVLQLPRSKVLELTALDDDQLDVLENGGTLTDYAMSLDEIDRMTVSELKARIKETAQTVDAKQALIEAKNAENDSLKEALARPFKPDPDSVAQSAEEQSLLDQLRDAVTAVETSVLQLMPLAQRVMDGSWSDACGLRGRQSVEYVAQRVADVFIDARIEVDFEARLTPHWVAKAKSHARSGKAGKAATES